MRLAAGHSGLTTCLLVLACLCGSGFGAVAEHVYWGQIIQGRIHDDPNLDPLHLVLIEFETDASVEAIEIETPAGYVDVIPSDEYTQYAGTETFHWVSDGVHRWEYWGYFEDADTLYAYGDGLYVFTIYYVDGSAEVTDVWYGVPGRDEAIRAPEQRPHLVWPSHEGAAASPLTFLWQPITDPYAIDVYLGIIDAEGRYVASDVYGPEAVVSDSYPLPEGWYDVELGLENFYPVTNPDGIPFDLLKTSMLFQPFEVVLSSVHRFWSPVTGVHFYTADEQEKDELIREHSDLWAYEGTAFYAWSTKYDPNLSPVYRFYAESVGTWLYTIDTEEKEMLIRDYPDLWKFEGVAFYAFEQGRQPVGSSPVYRFRDLASGSDFYTASEAEVDKLLSDYPDIFAFEGPAFYAYQ